MNAYSRAAKLWRKPSDELKKLQRERLIKWRREGSTIRLEGPSRLDRARALGYKAKSGIIVVRQRVDRGGRQRPTIRKARTSKHSRQIKILDINYRGVAEQRAAQSYPNMEVLNSYYIAEDGQHFWFEVILVDRESPEVLADENLIGIAMQRGRVNRGLTSATKKSRGLRHTGIGYEKARPSRTAAHKRKVRKQGKSYGFFKYS